MGKLGAKQVVKISDLKPYERNARTHSEEQVGQIAKSIEEFGFINPVLIDAEKNVIAGHGRIMAAQKLGMTEVPCLYVEGLTDEQRRAFILAENRLTELGDWDMGTVADEIKSLVEGGFDVSLTGFDFNIDIASGDNWFDARERWNDERQEGNEEYNAFLDKFENPKTTDDCYTPDNIYEVVANYAEGLSGIKRDKFVRPFYPGGDFENEKYPAGCAVVDNPPFSILARIVDFYVEHGVKFFLFAPALSALGYTNRSGVTSICVYEGVTYENGASVSTSFVTNMVGDDVAAMTAPELSAQIVKVNKENEARMSKTLPKYSFPMELVTSAKLGYLSKYGQDLKIMRNHSYFVRTLDAMKEAGGSGIYGCGLLLSKATTAEKAAAEKAAATVWKLSKRERDIIDSLGNDDKA